MTASLGRSEAAWRFRRRVLASFLLVLGLAFARQLVIAPMVGQDFHDMLAAAAVAEHGGNPYDFRQLAPAAVAMFDRPSHLQPSDPRYYQPLPFPEGPWLALALEPLVALPPGIAFAIYSLAMTAVLGLATWLSLGLAGWRGARRWWGLGLVMLSPVVFINIFQGQVAALVFLAAAAAWLLMEKERPVLAGVLLSLLWIKPNLGLVLPLAMALLQPAMARRMLWGFTAASMAAFGVAFLALGQALWSWPVAVLHFWNAVHATPWDVASLQAFPYALLPQSVATIAVLFVMLALIGAACWAVSRAQDGRQRAFTVVLAWFCALPYVHSYDAILLLPILLALLPRSERAPDDVVSELALWSFLIFPVLYFAGLHFGSFNSFTAIPVAVLAIAWARTLAHQWRGNALEQAA